ncbi:XdhC family protein [Arthrobacter sp. JSM 101049]|uniref:XdhC family protein n=1 Tax=Arthrobacter sp. JSM 101049 TaxID=929097 RepID=UPI00356B1AB4
MLDLLPDLEALLGEGPMGQACALATIVGSSGSVPRPVGTSMLVTVGGEVRGSLSGGCVEGAVLEACTEAMADGVPRREHFGYSADDAFAVGLMCGGSLEVLIQPLGPGDLGLPDRTGTVRVADGCALVRRIDGMGGPPILVADPLGFEASSIATELLAVLGDEGMARSAASQLEPLVRAGHTGVIRVAPAGAGRQGEPAELFVESRLPAPPLLVFGANDFAAALLETAKPLGYRTTLVDARAVFADPSAFSQADEVIVQWPHAYLEDLRAAGPIDPRTVVCVLTHDPKFDIPVLHAALGLGVAYVGAMGSRSSDRQRRAALLEAGTTPEQLARLRSPIGLDVGASTPQEVAVSIVAEILASRYGKDAPQPLSRVAGPIH